MVQLASKQKNANFVANLVEYKVKTGGVMVRGVSLLLAFLFVTGVVATAQTSVGAQEPEASAVAEQLVFPLKDKEILSAKGDSLMLIATLPNRKELWIYRASSDSIIKSKAEIFYTLPSFAFTDKSIAFYDLGMNRFVFTKMNGGMYESFLGDKLKGVVEPSLGVSLPRFYPFKNSWFMLATSAYVGMDSKLMYGVLSDEGKWEIQPQSIFDYPEGMTQNFGLVRSFASVPFNGRLLVCCEISGKHYFAEAYGRPQGMLMLTEFDGAFNKMRQVAVSDVADDFAMGKDVPTVLGMASMGNKLALAVKSDVGLHVKLFDANYKLLKRLSITNSTDVKTYTCLPIGGKGFVVAYSTAAGISLAYVSKEGELLKHWMLFDSSMADMNFYCMSSPGKLHILVRDSQRAQLVRKTIGIAELEK